MFPRGSQETFNKDYDLQTHSRVIPKSGEIALAYAAAPGRHVSFFPPFPAANQGLPNIFGGKNFADIVDGSFWPLKIGGPWSEKILIVNLWLHYQDLNLPLRKLGLTYFFALF